MELSLATFAGVPVIVRVLAVAVVVLAAGGLRIIWVDRTAPQEQHRSWALLELGFVVLAAGSLLGILDRSGTARRAGGGGIRRAGRGRARRVGSRAAPEHLAARVAHWVWPSKR